VWVCVYIHPPTHPHLYTHTKHTHTGGQPAVAHTARAPIIPPRPNWGAGGGGWQTGEGELQRASGGHRARCALRNRPLVVVAVAAVVVVVTTNNDDDGDNNNNNNSNNGGKVRVVVYDDDDAYFDPSTSDGSFAAGHTTHASRACLLVRACCLGPRPSNVAGLSGRLKRIMLEREPQMHTLHTHTYI